jgi:hypothetical protein
MRRRYNRPVVLYFDASRHYETFVIDVEVYEYDQKVTLVDQDGNVIGSMCEPMYWDELLVQIISGKFGYKAAYLAMCKEV